MYKVIKRTNAPNFPKNEISLWYEVDVDGENTEWRVCVADVIKRFSERYSVTEVQVPPFRAYEDFVEIVYLINGARAVFNSDHLLYTIFITVESEQFAKEISEFLGAQVGWEEL